MKPQWFQILLSLAHGTRHGAAIMEEVLERTDGHMKLWPATLYGSLAALENRGWIQAGGSEDRGSESGRRRFYDITPGGRSALGEEVLRLRKTLAVASALDLPADPEPTG